MTSVSGVSEAYRVALDGPEARVVQLPHPSIVFLAQNNDGRPALVARVDIDPQRHTVPDGRGYTAEVGATSAGRFLRLTSTRRGSDLLFEKLVEFVIERTSRPHSPDRAVDAIVSALTDFKAFSQRKPGRLSEAAIRGLFAELSFLLRLQAARNLTPIELFTSWGGPFGALHDVSLGSGESFEIKSTHRPPTTVRITSAAQTRPIDSPLWLAVLAIDRVGPGTADSTTLVDLASEVAGLAANAGGEVLDVWTAALESLGLDLADAFYDQWAFLPDKWRYYAVGEGFPRIAEASIPPGVVSVSYSLELSALDPFRAEAEILEVRP